MGIFNADSMAQNWDTQNLQTSGARQTTETAHGSATFANAAETAAAGKSGPLLVGRSPYDGQLLRYDGDGHLLTFAPTGAGKSVSVVVPNLLDYPGSVVCIDPKGAIAPITAAHRASKGQKIVLLDPFEEVEKAMRSRGQRHLWPTLSTSSYNPLGLLKLAAPDEIEDVVDEARLIAAGLIFQESEKNRFFSDSARMVLEGFILHLLSKNGTVTLEDLFVPVFDTPDNIKKVWLALMRKNTAFEGHVSHLAGMIENLTGDSGAAVWSTLYRSLNLIKSPRLLPALRPSDVDFSDLKDTPTTVYLVLPARHLHTHGVWLRLMLSSILSQLSDARASQYPVLLVVDECAALGRLEILETAIGLMRGYGLKLWLIFQDLPQLKSVYGERWESFISNSGLKQFFNVNDGTTADFVSGYLGNQTLYTLSENINVQGQLPGSSIASAGRALLTPDEVRRMGKNEQILFYERCKPIRAAKLCYYEDAKFRARDTGKKLFLDDPYVIEKS